MAERPSRNFGLLARLAFSVFGGFGLLLLGMAAVAVGAVSSSKHSQAALFAEMQLAYARAGVIAASNGPAPRPDAVASLREQLARSSTGVQLRVFDRGAPVGDDRPLDALDADGLAAVRADRSTPHGVEDPTYPGAAGYRFYAPLGAGADQVISVRFSTEPQTDNSSRIALRATAAMGLVMLLICAGLYFVLRRTTRRVTRLSRAVAGMAASGDFTVAIPADPVPDELGELSGGVRALAELLRTTAGTLQEASSRLADAGQALTRTAGEQSELLSRHSSAIEESAVSADELRQASETAVQEAEAVLEAAMRAGELGDTSESSVQQTLEAMGEIRNQVLEMGRQMAVVEERAHQIGGITQSVKDIADSSNMLALNAAIEAVRSGEQGKGFALVAREMRSLADQSIKATERVREILEDVSTAIQQATASSSRGTQRIETGLGQLTRSGESVRALAKMVLEGSRSARVIAAAVRRQNAGIVEIARSIADQRVLAERTSEGLTSTQTHAEALQALTRQVSELLKSYRI